MTISKNLLTAILSIDAYHRGGEAEGAGINLTGNKVGNATIKRRSDNIDLKIDGEDFKKLAKEAGFYAVEYDTEFGAVISYRGTDFTPAESDLARDAIHGWLFEVTVTVY
jgi:hypothetical protein